MSACNCNVSDFLFDPDSGLNLLESNIDNKPPHGNVLMPWVKIFINGDVNNPDADIITVGNVSQGANRAAAVIKAFSFGLSDGFTLKFEIVDIEGGNFCKFYDKLIKNLNDDIGEANQIKFIWGLKGIDCTSSSSMTDRTSSIHTAFITQIIPVLERGMYKFTLECIDLSDLYSQQIANQAFGRVTLVEAIQRLFKSVSKPHIGNVRYELRDGSGDLRTMYDKPDVPFFASDKGRDFQFTGPKAQWDCRGRNITSTLQDWLRMVKSINNQGFKFGFDSGPNGIDLVIRENDKQGCTKSVTDVFNKRVYVVNGGKVSQVISFTPNIKWTFIQSSRAGNVQAINQQEDIQNNNQNDCIDNAGNSGARAGINTSHEPDNAIMESEAGPDAGKRLIETSKLQFLAENVFEPINAELKVFGDPTYESFLDIGTFITIIVINPFVPSVSSNNCDWTIQTVDGDNSVCNSILTNKHWMIRGIHHHMESGAYVTTLDVHLTAPGVNFNENLGLP